MTRREKEPLRPLTGKGRETLGQIGRAQSEPASHASRRRVLLKVTCPSREFSSVREQ